MQMVRPMTRAECRRCLERRPPTSMWGIRLNFIRPGNNVTDQYLQVTNQAVPPQSAGTDAKARKLRQVPHARPERQGRALRHGQKCPAWKSRPVPGWNRSPKNGEVHDHSAHAGRQRRQRRRPARRPRGLGRHARDRPVPVADNGFLGRRHPQPLDRRHLLRVRRGTAAQDDVHLRRRPSAAFAAQDNGITPVEYVLVALGGCLTAGIASIAQQRKIQLRSVQATIEAEHDLHGILGADPRSATASPASG